MQEQPEGRRASGAGPGRGRAQGAEHGPHFHRWLPKAVRPFFLMGLAHTGHNLALADFLLTMRPSEPAHEARQKSSRPTHQHPNH
ncbi:hypothetical protein AB656_03200 [Bifidobacterium actinocoloniiforme DSM 22766]|nr:hypothetical protein AB656_03200 [Bifidobacterium actinocoloniiforme DSM 22766]